MAINVSEIEALIRSALPTAKVEVSGDGTHFAASVEAAEFKGLNRVQQHKLVYSAVQNKIQGSNGVLHALALTTKVPRK